MPFVVYLFALSAFALGLAEFVPIGLALAIARGLQVGVGQAGSAVTLYALGATFAAPVLSAVTAGWPRRRAVLAAMLAFAAGSLAAALAPDLASMQAARFVAGMGHGLFLAVASAAAAQLAGDAKAGRAVAVVFAGFTAAMAIGVPVGAYIGETISWRLVLAAIAACGGVGCAGLLWGMKAQPATDAARGAGSAGRALKTLLHPALLAATAVTVLAYAGSFSAYTYVAPLLLDTTGVDVRAVGMYMLAYGLFAAIGNALGGRLTDSLGVQRASVAIVAGIGAASLGMWAGARSPVAMGVAVAALGLFTYAAVPALQARLMGIARLRAPQAQGVAAGLNIAGFNSGIALGAWAGGLTLGLSGVARVGLAGGLLALLGLALLLWQARTPVSVADECLNE